MAPRRRTKLPPNTKPHGRGFRGVVTIEGRRRYGPVHRTPDEAAAWVRSILGSTGDEAAPLTLATAQLLLEQDLVETGARDGTVRYYRRACLELQRVLGPDLLLHQLDAPAIRHYLDVRKRKGIALQTIVRKELATLRRICRLAMRHGQLAHDPFARVQLPRVRTGRFDTISPAQVASAIERIAAENQQHADIVALLWFACLRRAEAARLTAQDVDLPGRRLFVEGKTRDRYRPIATALVPHLERLIEAAGDGPLVQGGVRKIEHLFARWARRLDLGAFSPHVLRHGFASDLLARGTPPHVVASLMGHSGLRMLERYFHAQDQSLRAAVDAIGTPRT